jgi:hypothetical protein
MSEKDEREILERGAKVVQEGVQDLPAQPQAAADQEVTGGACASGTHIKEAIITC